MDATTICLLLALHFIADFVFQPQSWRQQKSSNSYVLLAHSVTYAVVISLIMTPITGLVGALFMLVVLGFTHFVIDFISSRITKRLFEIGDPRNAFDIIGLDQLIHSIILVFTFVFAITL